MLTPAAAVGISVIASIGNSGIGFLVIDALQLIGALWTAFTVRIPRH